MTMQENPLIAAAQSGPDVVAPKPAAKKRTSKSRFDKIWQTAWNNPIPNAYLSPSETIFWQSAALTSQLYRLGGITEESGKKIKEKLRAQYAKCEKADADLARVGTAMKLLKNSTVPEVQQVVKQVNDMFDDGAPWQ